MWLTFLFSFSLLFSAVQCFPSKAVRTKSQLFAISGELKTILKKPSKTLAAVLEVDLSNSDDGDVAVRSMQLRKTNVSALYTRDFALASKLVKEQSSAKGNFPGPCPIIYEGKENLNDAFDAGVSAIVTSDLSIKGQESENIIFRVSSAEDVKNTVASNEDANAFLIEARSEELIESCMHVIPNGAIVIASCECMQDEEGEIELAKKLKSKGITSILIEKAIVGDNEDLEYASFLINGLTKKKSTAFNMTGECN